MCNDTIGFLRAATAGVAVNDETLALDVIDELGPTGSFLGHDHTIRHYKEPFYSKLADKGPYSSWADKGATTMEQRAAAMVDRILAKHTDAAAFRRSSGGHPGDRRPRAEVDRRAKVTTCHCEGPQPRSNPIHSEGDCFVGLPPSSQ